MTHRRGQVWWARISGVGDKPVLIVSADTLNRVLDEVTVARITAVERERVLPTYVKLEAGEVENLPARSFVICHNIYTLPKRSLKSLAGELASLRLLAVEDALGAALDLPASV